jgi:hypothetical protein
MHPPYPSPHCIINITFIPSLINIVTTFKNVENMYAKAHIHGQPINIVFLSEINDRSEHLLIGKFIERMIDLTLRRNYKEPVDVFFTQLHLVSHGLTRVALGTLEMARLMPFVSLLTDLEL